MLTQYVLRPRSDTQRKAFRPALQEPQRTFANKPSGCAEKSGGAGDACYGHHAKLAESCTVSARPYQV